MAARLKPVLLPLVLLVIAFWLIYTCHLNPDPHWRYPKAEVAGPIFALVGVPWLLYTLYRAARPYQLSLGARVMFKNGQNYETAFITHMEGDLLSVRAETGTYQLNRYDVEGLVWTPKPGDVVRARWPDGSTSFVLVGQVHFDQVLIRAQDGREMWVPMGQLGKR